MKHSQPPSSIHCKPGPGGSAHQSPVLTCDLKVVNVNILDMTARLLSAVFSDKSRDILDY